MIISSQSYRDYNIVDEKIYQIAEDKIVEIPVTFAGELNGEQYFIQVDGHHTMEAAKELEIEIRFVEVAQPTWDNDWTIEDVLAANYNDCDWYNVETGQSAF